MCMDYDPMEMKCRVFEKSRADIVYWLHLKIPFTCILQGEGMCRFGMVVSRWETSRALGGMRIVFYLEAEKDLYDIGPTLRYSLFLPDNGLWIQERAVLKVCREVELVSFHIPWNVSGGEKGEYLPIPFSDNDTRPGPALLTDVLAGNSLYEGLLFHFGNVGMVMARAPGDRKPQWICLSGDGDGSVSFAGICAGLVEKSDSGKEEYRRMRLGPDKACDFLETRYMFYSGRAENGLYLYRAFMKSRGICMPTDYDPPFNYCVYYEYPGYFAREELMEEADLAASLGCTLLYTDQGWEDYFGNGIWDTKRLGALEEMVEELSQRGLALGVLVGMHMKAYCMPKSVWRRDSAGKINRGDPWHPVGVCAQSPVWQRIKRMRLKKLALCGIRFMSFDFNNYENVCHAQGHRHEGCSGEWEHAAALARMQAGLKKECPNLLIEAHDWLNAGTYTYPVYLFPKSCHERWGFEYMWAPFEDFKSGRLRNLYYYNMAYEKPMYLHIDLADDNAHMTVFWYIASTVRHLGIGNFSQVEEGRKEVCKEAISRYCEVKEYLTRGTFWGIDPMIHVHHLDTKGSILFLFNDRDEGRRVYLELSGEEMSWMGKGRAENVWGPAPDMKMREESMTISVWLEAYDVSVVLIR